MSVNTSISLSEFYAKKIRTYRRLHMTQPTFADFLNVSPRTVSRLENGSRDYKVSTFALLLQ